MNYKIIFVLLVFFVLSEASFSFEESKIEFSNITSKKNSVVFNFKGEVFDPPLDVFVRKERLRSDNHQRFYDFFKSVHQANLEGKMHALLKIWHPDDHLSVSSAMDKKALDKNRESFNSLKEMQLLKLIQYGDFYICFVAMRFGLQPVVVMKFPVTEFEGGLVLSNGLNGDHFYDYISHFLDETNYKTLAQ